MAHPYRFNANKTTPDITLAKPDITLAKKMPEAHLTHPFHAPVLAQSRHGNATASRCETCNSSPVK